MILLQTLVGAVVILLIGLVVTVVYNAWLAFGWWTVGAALGLLGCWIIGALVLECMEGL